MGTRNQALRAGSSAGFSQQALEASSQGRRGFELRLRRVRLFQSRAVQSSGLMSLGTPPHWQGGRSMRSLWLAYNEKPFLNKWLEYADHYQAHLPVPAEGIARVRMLEIGVQSGGSTRLWKQWYGQRLYYVGVDINPKTKRSESVAESIYISVGSQTNATFLHELCAMHGPFDVVIDDGAHMSAYIRKTLSILFPSNACMANRSTYVIEDMHTMMMTSGKQSYGTSAEEFYGLVGEAFWSMHFYWGKADFGGGAQQHPIFLNLVGAVHLYDSIAFISRGRTYPKLTLHRRGRDSIHDPNLPARLIRRPEHKELIRE